MKNVSNFLWGLVLIVVGVVWGLNATGVADINIFFDGWWTLFIIIPCFIGLLTEKDKMGNLIGLLIGVMLLLVSRQVFSLSLVWKLFLPSILVFVGLSLLFKDTLSKKVREEIKKIEPKGEKEYCATFSNQNLNFKEEKFDGCSLTSIFGGIKCNLVDSEIESKTLIKATSVFGGIDIIVPEDVSVKVVSTSIFGGVSNKREKVDSKKILYIEATCLFGGVDIK